MTSSAIAVAATVGCAVAVAALLVAEAIRSRTGRMVAKPIAAGLFLVVAIARASDDGSGYAAFVLGALALGALGDVALMLPQRRAFAIGLGLFALGHGATLRAVAHVSPPDQWLGWPALVPIAVAAATLVSLWPHLSRLGLLRFGVVAYIALLVAVECAALSVLAQGTVQGWRLAAGTTLFFLSDIAVARHRFVSPRLINKLWGLPAYFAGQLFIAWSIGAG